MSAQYQTLLHPPGRRRQRAGDVRLAGTPEDFAPGEIRVYRVQMADFHPWLDQLESLLTPSEKERWQRYSSQTAKEQFLIARALLRLLLAGFTNTSPDRVALRSTPEGKLILGRMPHAVHFNVSHSASTALLAFSRDREMGVDVEVTQPVAVERLAAHLLPPGEVKLLQDAPASLARTRFTYMWSRMEACAKATGRGVANTLAVRHAQSFHGAPWCHLLGLDAGLVTPVVRSFRLGPGLSGSVASFGLNWTVTARRLLPADGCAAGHGGLVCDVIDDGKYQKI